RMASSESLTSRRALSRTCARLRRPPFGSSRYISAAPQPTPPIRLAAVFIPGLLIHLVCVLAAAARGLRRSVLFADPRQALIERLDEFLHALFFQPLRDLLEIDSRQREILHYLERFIDILFESRSRPAMIAV